MHGYFPAEQVTVTGVVKEFERTGDSGAFIEFHFCPDCGSTVYWKVEATPERIGIPVGVFADPSFPQPTVAVFVPHKHPWVVVPEGVPQNNGHSARFLAAAQAAVARRSK